jgi:hypothetical protein
MSDKDYNTFSLINNTFSLINIRVREYEDYDSPPPPPPPLHLPRPPPIPLDDVWTGAYTSFLGYLSPNLLNIYNTKGYWDWDFINASSAGQWFIQKDDPVISEVYGSTLGLTFKNTDTDGIHRILSNPPILNGIKLESPFINVVNVITGGDLLVVFFVINNLSLEAGKTYTLSFPDGNPSKVPLPIINNKDELRYALVVYMVNKNIYQPPNNWDVSKVTDMSLLFQDYATFNENIGDLGCF